MTCAPSSALLLLTRQRQFLQAALRKHYIFSLITKPRNPRVPEKMRQAGDRGVVHWGSEVPSKQFVTSLKERVVSCQKEAQLCFALGSF